MLRSEGSQSDKSGKGSEFSNEAPASMAAYLGNLASTARALRAESGVSGTDSPSPSALARMVEGEIIPRLLVNCRTQGTVTPFARPGSVKPDVKDIDMLASSAIRDDAQQLLAQVEAQMARGISLESMLVDMLAPAARLLGEWWEQDACDFIDVTMGLWRLQEVVHDIAGRAGAQATRASNCRTALFSVAPGDDHAFGSLMVEEMFRHAGWSGRTARNHSADQLVAEVRQHYFDLVALTVSTDRHIDALAELIAAMRNASCNPDIIIMVGGWMFNQDASLCDHVGADASAPDGRSAVTLADMLMQSRFEQPSASAGAA